MSDSSQL